MSVNSKMGEQMVYTPGKDSDLCLPMTVQPNLRCDSTHSQKPPQLPFGAGLRRGVLLGAVSGRGLQGLFFDVGARRTQPVQALAGVHL
jgi:hypothetical protein